MHIFQWLNDISAYTSIPFSCLYHLFPNTWKQMRLTQGNVNDSDINSNVDRL